MLFVHHVVTGGELERVDAAAAAARHPARVPRARVLPDQVRLGEHGQPHGLPDEPTADERGGHARHAREIGRNNIAPGDIALFRMLPRGPAKHCGIVSMRVSD